jgi:hypothetical protein
MAEQRMQRDLTRLCRELGLPEGCIERSGHKHLKVRDASGRLLASIPGTPRSHDDAMKMARRYIGNAMRAHVHKEGK